MDRSRLLLLFVLLFALGQVQAQPERLVADPITASLGIYQADSLIWQIMSARTADRYDEAVQLYLALLTRLDDDVSAAEADVLLKHVRTATMVLPTTIRLELALDEALEQTSLDALHSDVGSRLVQWWHRQDTFPATEINERLEEHLARVAYAIEAYANPVDPRGFDDRGERYVRFGAPDKQGVVQVNPAMLAFDFRNVAPAVQIPENEIWIYRRVSDAAYYVFLRDTRNQPFRLGGASDLLPLALRNGIIRNQSGPHSARLLLGIMEEVYGQLVLLHPAYGALYEQIAGYRALPPTNASRSDQVVQRTLMLAQAEDDAATWRRTQEVPASYTKSYGQAEDLILPIRWARFLEPDGTTRTEIYWGMEAQALQPSRRLVRELKQQGQVPSEQYLLSLSVAQCAADYRSRAIQHKHYRVPAEVDGVLGTQTLTVRGDTGRYHLAVQWEQRWLQARTQGSGNLEPGARLKIGTTRIDSLDALRTQGLRLEMSDLKPLVRMPSEASGEDMSYPFDSLPPSQLTLYFELYYLTYGADDRTHYTIAYEVTSRVKERLLPFVRRSEEGAAVRTSYTSSDRVAKEYIDLDLSAWQGKGDLVITVRVTDEVSGTAMTRTISFAS